MDGCAVVEAGSVLNITASQALYYLPMADDFFFFFVKCCFSAVLAEFALKQIRSVPSDICSTSALGQKC